MKVLVVNVGSSSLKLSLLDHDDAVLRAENLPADAPDEVIEAFLAESGRPDAIGHRIVHGGAELDGPTPIDGAVLERLDDAARLAPLHDPPAIAMVRRLLDLHPEVPAVACFDTTFHRTIRPERSTYAVPKAWRDAGVRRYGFHGLSYAYACRRAAQLLRAAGDRPSHRLVVCHLGAGASVCAIAGGRSQDTTMGFTPVEGLVMATRSGDVDPGALMWIQQQLSLSASAMEQALNHGSGLVGLTGTADLSEVIGWTTAGRAEGDPRTFEAAALAIDVYVTRAAKAVASMVVALGGLDALVFTGGVGEHAPEVRARVGDLLHHLGVRLGSANATVDVDAHGDADISDPDAAVRTLVIKAREDLEIAREVRAAHDAT